MKEQIIYKHEPKACPRCSSVFECKVGNVEQCQCSNITMNDQTQKHIRETYADCLCINCLKEVRSEQSIRTFYARIRKLFGIANHEH